MINKELDVNLPHSSREMASMGTRIDRSDLRPGDLVFFKNGKNRINHVGIFVGNDTFVHSSLSKGITRDTLNESYYSKRFATGVRILDIQGNHLPDDFTNLIDESNSSDSPS
jgi:lipoprotein Spr